METTVNARSTGAGGTYGRFDALVTVRVENREWTLINANPRRNLDLRDRPYIPIRVHSRPFAVGLSSCVVLKPSRGASLTGSMSSPTVLARLARWVVLPSPRRV